MPYRPASPCTYPGCGQLVMNGSRCDKHRRQEMRAYNQRRGSATRQGYGARWQAAREAYLRLHPLCVMCIKHGLPMPATIVDHIIPHKGDQDLFWDEKNWQALCKACHDSKTARSDGRWGGAGRISGGNGSGAGAHLENPASEMYQRKAKHGRS